MVYNKIYDIIKKHQKYIALLIGIFAVIYFMIPYFKASENSYINVHDNLDSGILFYQLKVKYFFRPTAYVSELMNGMKATNINVSSLFSVLFFALFSPIHAYLINDLFVRLFAFIGLFLLLNRITSNKYLFVSLFASILYSFLPYYSVYGLSVAGQPFLAFCIINVLQNKYKKLSYLGIFFFGISSSLVLSGYYLLMFLGLTLFIKNVYSLFKYKKLDRSIIIAFLLLLIAYLISNYDLIISTFFDSNFHSQRELWGIASRNWKNVMNSANSLYTTSQYHSESNHAMLINFNKHVLIIVPIIIFLSFLLFKTYDKNQMKIFIIFASLFYLAYALCILNYLFYLKFFVNIFIKLPAFKYFNWGRFHFSFAGLWFLAFGVAIFLLIDTIQKFLFNSAEKIKITSVTKKIFLTRLLNVFIISVVILSLFTNFPKYQNRITSKQYAPNWFSRDYYQLTKLAAGGKNESFIDQTPTFK